ncbi:hypothetical protein OA101_01845 [Alphaproteobacteria bacterium]|nr:hypothetical protein [Alphaproteobacteria bacterium]
MLCETLKRLEKAVAAHDLDLVHVQAVFDGFVEVRSRLEEAAEDLEFVFEDISSFEGRFANIVPGPDRVANPDPEISKVF